MRSLAPRQHEQHELCDLKETRVLESVLVIGTSSVTLQRNPCFSLFTETCSSQKAQAFGDAEPFLFSNVERLGLKRRSIRYAGQTAAPPFPQPCRRCPTTCPERK